MKAVLTVFAARPPVVRLAEAAARLRRAAVVTEPVAGTRLARAAVARRSATRRDAIDEPLATLQPGAAARVSAGAPRCPDAPLARLRHAHPRPSEPAAIPPHHEALRTTNSGQQQEAGEQQLYTVCHGASAQNCLDPRYSAPF